jgi:hypothetical protein
MIKPVEMKRQIWPCAFLKSSTTPWRRIGEWRYSSTHSLTSVLGGGEWSASRPGRFTPRERAPSTLWIEGWVGPRAVLEAVVKKKVSSLRRESNPRIPIVQPAAQPYTDWAITNLKIKPVGSVNWKDVGRRCVQFSGAVMEFVSIDWKNSRKSTRYSISQPRLEPDTFQRRV